MELSSVEEHNNKSLYNTDSTNILIFKRSNPAGIENYLEELRATSFPALDINLSAVNVNTVLKNYFNVISLEQSSLNQVLIRHIEELCFEFCHSTNLQHFRLYFGRVTNGMCHLFHIDQIHFRGLKTFIGPGTEWISSELANYSALGKGKNRKVIRRPENVRKAGNNDFLIFKGSKSSDYPLIHRSPPVEHSNEHRLLLRIDSQLKK